MKKASGPPLTLKVGTGLMWWRGKQDPPMSQESVAELVGMSKSTYNLVEQGRLLPSPHVVDELCRIFGVPAGALFVPEVLRLVIQYGVTGDPRRHVL